MKLNKLKLEDSLQNSAQPSTTGSKLFSKLKASENPEPSEETTAQNVSGTGIFSKLRTTETNTVDNKNRQGYSLNKNINLVLNGKELISKFPATFI